MNIITTVNHGGIMTFYAYLNMRFETNKWKLTKRIIIYYKHAQIGTQTIKQPNNI